MNRNTPKSLVNLNQVHKENLKKRLTHRLEAARAKGNQDLVQMLEAEKQLLD
ncbi:MAG: hypothetical protein VKJ25_17445 [Okeania sp.]|nr:hypothetical protein [Okeania sp.]